MKNILAFLGCFLGFVGSVEAEETCMCDRMSDSLALVDLYWATGGEDWSYSSTVYYFDIGGGIIQAGVIPSVGNIWDFNQPIDTWHGVGLSTEGCVEKLILNGNNLAGELIDLNLPNLRSFHCYTNSIEGAIPDFSNLPNLQFFRCGDNLIEGAIPDFSNLSNLQVFHCDNNLIEGAIPDFSNLSNLQDYTCSNNLLTGSLPNFNNLPNLVIFRCDFNSIMGEIPDFDNLLNLNALHCWNNLLTGEIPDFGNLPNLEFLDLDDNFLVGNIPDFQNTPNLEYLYCSGNSLSGNIFDFNEICPDIIIFQHGENRHTFENILPFFNSNNDIVTQNGMNINLSGELLGYFPQDTIFTPTQITQAENTPLVIDLLIDENITDNEYNWYKNGELYTTIIGNNDLSFANLQNTDAGIYTVEVTNSGAPELTLISHEIEIIVEERELPDNFVPEGFTPNGDGVNDQFIIPELEDPTAFPNNKIIIFNRWGDIVFEQKNYRNTWGGEYQNTGQLLPAGTYYYMIWLDVGEGEIREGSVVIIR
jgi:gliding motility-associated-like protein